MEPFDDGEEAKEDQENEVLNFDNPTYVFRPYEHHEWRQQGPYIVCKSCELDHSVHIGMGRILVGINDKGQPLLKRR